MKNLTIAAAIIFGTILLGLITLVYWMRAGEEEPLDYGYLSYDLGPQNPEMNGYTYLQKFCQETHPDIPEDFPVKFDENFDIIVNYNLYENWDLEFFQQIVNTNREFMDGFERAFERHFFMPDQRFTSDTFMSNHVGEFRSYISLRLLEARIEHLSGASESAINRLADLAEELKVQTKSGGALIGLLTSIAMNGILTEELRTYQVNVDVSASQWKGLAESFDTEKYLANAFQLTMRQEFQFLENSIEALSQDAAALYELISFEQPSTLQILTQKFMLFAGLRKNRTLNEIFLAYSETIEQADLPLKLRKRVYVKKIEDKLDRGGGWKNLVHRNPYGHILLAILYPATGKVTEIVDRTKASIAATRISFALHAYYLEKGTLPESLNNLIPEYLPEVPNDPYDGQTMRYSKEKKIVYAIGNDFVDNGGSNLPFQFEIDLDDNDDAAEHDNSEPTYPLRFAF